MVDKEATATCNFVSVFVYEILPAIATLLIIQLWKHVSKTLTSKFIKDISNVPQNILRYYSRTVIVISCIILAP